MKIKNSILQPKFEIRNKRPHIFKCKCGFNEYKVNNGYEVKNQAPNASIMM